MYASQIKTLRDKATVVKKRIQKFTDTYLVPRRLNRPYPYLVSPLAVAIGVFLSARIPLLHDRPTLASLSAIVFAAWYGGLGPSLFAVLLSILGLDYFVFDPISQINLGIKDLPPLIAFSLAGILVGSLVASLRRSEELLEQVALSDHLTRLPNRKLFEDRLETALAFANRNNKLLAVVFLDIDDFKYVNDRWGHKIGDEALIHVAKLLKENTREEDTISRWGGDEFVLIFPDLTGPEDIEVIMQKIFLAFAGNKRIDGIDQVIRISCGVSIYPLTAVDPSTLMRTADEALYKAKRDGKNQYQIYSIDKSNSVLPLAFKK